MPHNRSGPCIGKQSPDHDRWRFSELDWQQSAFSFTKHNTQPESVTMVLDVGTGRLVRRALDQASIPGPFVLPSIWLLVPYKTRLFH